MYRIYVGEYVKEGLPNTWTLVHISKIYPSGILNKLNENIKYGNGYLYYQKTTS